MKINKYAVGINIKANGYQIGRIINENNITNGANIVLWKISSI
jgi:hypothetical protein